MSGGVKFVRFDGVAAGFEEMCGLLPHRSPQQFLTFTTHSFMRPAASSLRIFHTFEDCS